MLSFCFELGTAALEMHEVLKGKNSMRRKQTFEWCTQFKYGEMSVEDHEHSDHPSADENAQQNTIIEIIGSLGLSHGTCQQIVREDLQHLVNCCKVWALVAY